jgi:hypothetical protein
MSIANTGMPLGNRPILKASSALKYDLGFDNIPW